jgi:hypothetical protein
MYIRPLGPITSCVRVVSVTEIVPAAFPPSLMAVSSNPKRLLPDCEIVTVTVISWPAVYVAGSPVIDRVPAPVLAPGPKWQSVQFGSLGAPVTPAGGPSRKASARLPLSTSTKQGTPTKPMITSFSNLVDIE